MRRERNTLMETAWLAAMAPHQKDVWPLESLLTKEDAQPMRKQDWQVMKETLRVALN